MILFKFLKKKDSKCTNWNLFYVKNKFNVTKMIKFPQRSCKFDKNEVKYILYGKAFLFRQ